MCYELIAIQIKELAYVLYNVYYVPYILIYEHILIY